MIRVTIELVPYGIGKPQLLHQIEIANDGTGSAFVGDYKARRSRKGATVPPWQDWDDKVVTKFPRQRLNVLHLLHRVLNHYYNRKEHEQAG